jgi:hypothetical protein
MYALLKVSRTPAHEPRTVDGNTQLTNLLALALDNLRPTTAGDEQLPPTVRS